MKRLAATFLCDVRLQYRNGFYYAAAVVTALAGLLLARLAAGTQDGLVAWLLPAVIVNNLLINTFYFVGGLVLLEKGEGTLEAQVVSPLRASEYLGAKVGTLLLLSLVENVSLAWLVAGPDLSLPALVAAISLAAGFYTLAGFAIVARYESLNEYLLPSFLFISLLALPLLPYFGIGTAPWIQRAAYLHPLQPVLLLLQGGFGPLATGESAYVLLAGSLWLGVAAWAAHQAYERFIVRGI